MPLRIGVQMDPLPALNFETDSTLSLMEAAQRRGHLLFHYLPEHLTWEGGELWAKMQAVELFEGKENRFHLGAATDRRLVDLEVILLRQNPPFNTVYITTTYFLETLADRVLIANDPQAVRDCPEKLFVMQFPEFMPETLITRERRKIETFRDQYGDIVLKPLYGNSGQGVFKLGKEDPNFGALVDLFAEHLPDPWVVQRFLPGVRKGDKRIVLINGQVGAALNRVPQGREIRSNLGQGGVPALVSLTHREEEICAKLGPELRKRGLLLAGIDVIDNCLTEINVTSPTGLRTIKNLGGPDLAEDFWKVMEAAYGSGRSLRAFMAAQKL